MQIQKLYLSNQSLLKIRARLFRFLRSTPVSISIAILSAIFCYQYFQTKIYKFPKPEPFQGEYLYNPYGNLNGKWLKANLHAHAKSWFGLTNGKQSGDELIKAYKKFDYDIAGISDYHRINNSIYVEGNIAIPVYEHGINISKVHQSAIGATDVTFYDVFLWQNTSIRQFLLNKLKEHAPVVAINHPAMWNGYSENDMANLTGYECLEVLNSNNTFFPHWDAALSSGRPVWILANDDCHDLNKENFAIAWTLVNATEPSPNEVITALKNGSTIGVKRKAHHSNYNTLQESDFKSNGQVLKEVFTKGETVIFRFDTTVINVNLIGQNGDIKASFNNTDSITYTFNKNDTYIRAVAETNDFDIYLNPILRYNGTSAVVNTSLAQVEILSTIIMRVGILLSYSLLTVILFPTFFSQLFYGVKKPDYTYYEQVQS